MGCCGSVDKDAAERPGANHISLIDGLSVMVRLQTVEKEIQALGLRADEESLSEAQRLSKELRELFEVFASSADMRMIEKVQENVPFLLLLGGVSMEHRPFSLLLGPRRTCRTSS